MFESKKIVSCDAHIGGAIWKNGIEDEIRPVVQLLESLGVYVEMACAGHAGFDGLDEPYVYFHTKDLSLAFRIHLCLVDSQFWCLMSFFSPDGAVVEANPNWKLGDLRFRVKRRPLREVVTLVDQRLDLVKALQALTNDVNSPSDDGVLGA